MAPRCTIFELRIARIARIESVGRLFADAKRRLYGEVGEVIGRQERRSGNQLHSDIFPASRGDVLLEHRLGLMSPAPAARGLIPLPKAVSGPSFLASRRYFGRPVVVPTGSGA